jgi:hypothetical protein
LDRKWYNKNMATYSKITFSGATDGTPIKVVATASTGTTIHTTGISATVFDEIWLYAYNSDTAARLLTIQYGGTTAVDDDIKITIPPQSGLTLVIPGLILTGTGSAGNSVYAYAATANVITVSGYINRIA